MGRLLFSLCIIVSGLAIGSLIQQSAARGVVRSPFALDSLRNVLQKIALLGVLPVTVLGAIWIVDVRSATIAALPLIGVGAITLGGVLALGAGWLFKLPPRRAGALFPCGSFTNIGAIGALTCFMFLGEKGFARVPIYKLIEEVTYYSVGFPIAKYFSSADAGQETVGDRLKSLSLRVA